MPEQTYGPMENLQAARHAPGKSNLAYEPEELPDFSPPPPLEPLYGHVFKPDTVNPLCAECGYRLIEHPLRPAVAATIATAANYTASISAGGES